MLKKVILLLIASSIFMNLSYAAQNVKVKKTVLQNSVKKEIKVTFVELGSKNCIPCKMMQKVMDEIEKEYGEQVKVVFHDVWTEKGRPYGEKYGIRAIPTQVFLDKNGKEYARHEGFFPKEELVKILEKGGVSVSKSSNKSK